MRVAGPGVIVRLPEESEYLDLIQTWRHGAEKVATDSIDLVNLPSAREERFPGHQLGKDAAYGPHVNGCSVIFRAE